LIFQKGKKPQIDIENSGKLSEGGDAEQGEGFGGNSQSQMKEWRTEMPWEPEGGFGALTIRLEFE
jgi:hypothetical protein